MEHVVKVMSHYTVAGLEILGIIVICVVALVATALAVGRVFKKTAIEETYHKYRHALIRGTLVGLEILVAADIIQTVTVAFDFESIGTLSILVLIRTFLSFTLEVELGGRWPWQEGQDESPTVNG